MKILIGHEELERVHSSEEMVAKFKGIPKQRKGRGPLRKKIWWARLFLKTSFPSIEKHALSNSPNKDFMVHSLNTSKIGLVAINKEYPFMDEEQIKEMELTEKISLVQYYLAQGFNAASKRAGAKNIDYLKQLNLLPSNLVQKELERLNVELISLAHCFQL